MSNGVTKVTETSISITEVTVITGKNSKLSFDYNGQKVSITVPVELKAYFDAQFSRANPTALQKKKYATLMNLLRYAYTQGQKDAKK